MSLCSLFENITFLVLGWKKKPQIIILHFRITQKYPLSTEPYISRNVFAIRKKEKAASLIVKYACRPDGGWWSSPPSAHKMFRGLFTYSHCTATGFKVTFLLQNRKTPPLSLPIVFCLKIRQIGCCKISVLVITTFTITFIYVHIEKLYIPTFTNQC